MKKFIFLDFDGVLHSDDFESSFFTFSKDFCEAIRPYKNDIYIVISSSWRETHSLESLKSHFDNDIQPLIVGVTPVHIEGRGRFGRYREILDYCTMHNILQEQWIALDDEYYLFPSECQNLILTNKNIGLNKNNLQQLVRFIATA